MLRQTICLICLTMSLTYGSLAVAHEGHGVVSKEMISVAQAFLNSLDPKLRQQATFAFDSPVRTNWHFIPKERLGVMLKELSLEQRREAHRFIRSALSNKGYLKAVAVMSLERILRELERDRPDAEQRRDEEKYWFAIFGEPQSAEPWGWRVEGHHLSLNFSSIHGLVVSTPMFFGANPAEIRTGPKAGFRVLGREENIARRLVQSLDASQRQRAVIAVEAPSDVITGPGQEIDLGDPAGLPAADMSSVQAKMLVRLISEYFTNLRPELAHAELESIDRGGPENIYFAWAGGLEPGQGHYYRIHGPTFVIEYDSTQNDANHIHTVWHSLTDDFALDMLRRHYSEAPHGKNDE